MVVVNDKIISMIKEGISLNKVSKATGLGKSTLYFHYKKINGKKTIPIVFNFKKDDEIGEFIGIFAGDGTFYKRVKTGHYSISIYTGYYEKEYAKYLENKFSKWFSKKPRVYYREYLGKKSLITTNYYSKQIYDLIKEHLEWKGIKTYSVKLKNFNLKEKDFNRGFLRGLIDTDGSFYTPKRRLSFSSVSKELANQAYYIIENLLGIRPNLNIIKKEGKHDLYTISLHGENAKRLINLINPSNPNKRYAVII